ncbi:MAG: hypothetical protein QOD41_1433 [Cryptosporangiaceae bacterium]|nr:hypothetical protein [Cryptosporangiaceae bacterium]
METRLSAVTAAILAVSSPASSTAPAAATRWATMPAMPPAAGAERAEIRGITAPSASDVWAVGAWWQTGQSRPLVMHWDGTAWSGRPIPAAAGDAYDLTTVDATGPDDVWAAGSVQSAGAAPGPVALLRHFDGKAWTSVSLPVTADGTSEITDLDMTSPSEGWAVGSEYVPGVSRHSLVLRLQAGQWTRISAPPIDAAGTTLNSVYAGADDAWAVGERTGKNSDGVGVVLHYDGQSWENVPVPDGAGPGQSVTLDSVAEASPVDVWAVGSRCTTLAVAPPSCSPVALRLAGGVWRPVASPGFATELTEVVPRTTKDVVIVGYSGLALLPGSEHDLVQHWDGAALTPEPTIGGVTTQGELSSALSVAALTPATGDIWAAGWTANSPLSHVLHRS